MIEVSLRIDEIIDEMSEFNDPLKAERYFYELARKRTKLPYIVMATVDGEPRWIYHIDTLYSENRWGLSLDLMTGLAVTRRYIPSHDELSGRKPTRTGRRLPPMVVDLNMYSQLHERAQRAGITLADLRREAYRKLLDEGDTILSEILHD